MSGRRAGVLLALGLVLSAATGAAAQTALPGGREPAPAQGGMAAMHGGAAAALPPVSRQIAVPAGAFGIALPELGVEIIAIRLAAAGGLLDLRYRVLDPERAKPLRDPAVPIGLVDPRTGAQTRVPIDDQVGALRQTGTALRPGQVLATLFGNPGRALRKGDLVNLRLGTLQIAGLTIQG